MISENYTIDEFVEAVKGKTSWDVIALAVEEATQADRLFLSSHHRSEPQTLPYQTYSRHLKRLINYLRFAVKPRRPNDRAYRLYVQHWGDAGREAPDRVTGQPRKAIH